MKQASLFGRGSAEFSDEEVPVYRYRLERWFQPAPPVRPVLFIMLNPSKAGADDNDPTISVCENFTWSWGHDGLVVVNLYAFIATDPRDLVAAHRRGVDVVGPDNDAHILAAARAAKMVVCAWGAGGGQFDRAAKVLAMLKQYGRTPQAIGLTADGHPKHPLARGQHTIPRSAKPFPLPVGAAGGGGPELPAAA